MSTKPAPIALTLADCRLDVLGFPEQLSPLLAHNFGAMLRADDTKHRTRGELEIRAVSSAELRHVPAGRGTVLHKAVVIGDARRRRRLTVLYDPTLRAERLFYYVLEPALLTLIKRCEFYPIHASGVACDDAGILIPGRTGAGKTTLAYRLCRTGCRFLCNDQAFLRRRRGHVELVGLRDRLALDETSLSLFPELSFLRDAYPVHHGPVQKWELGADELCRVLSRPAREPSDRVAAVQHIVFPEGVRANRTSQFAPLSRTAVFQRLMNIRPRNWPSLFDDRPTIEFQFHLLKQLAEQAHGYRFRAGSASDGSEFAAAVPWSTGRDAGATLTVPWSTGGDAGATGRRRE